MDPTILNALLLRLAASRRSEQTLRMRTGQSGQEYVQELLGSAYLTRVLSVLQMQLDTFYALRDWLLANTDLKGNNVTYNQRIRGGEKEVSIEEKLMIFIYIISRAASNRDTCKRFLRSRRTISWYVQ